MANWNRDVDMGCCEAYVEAAQVATEGGGSRGLHLSLSLSHRYLTHVCIGVCV